MQTVRVVLYADDEEFDRFLLEEAFRKSGVRVQTLSVEDGQQALEYLSGLGRFADRKLWPIPDLVLLDVKMPVMSGFEVLEWIRRTPAWSRLPVSILSSSAVDRDQELAKGLGANEYLEKPLTLEEWIQMVRGLHDRWLADPARPVVRQLRDAGRASIRP